MEVLEKPLEVLKTAPNDFLPLYEELFPVCARWVRGMNGSLTDAEDIFQDALIIYLEKSDHLRLISASREAYILGIVKHLWIRKFRKDKLMVSLTEFESTLSIPANFVPSVSDIRLLNFLERTGRICLELLRTFYYEKLSMKELSKKMGYRSEHSATVQKYKCIEKLRTSIKEKSLSYEDFIE